MSSELIILIILIVLSGFFSSSELAYVVANKIKIELKARKNNLPSKNALYFVKNPENFFGTILISNNIVNVAFASLITVFLINTYQFDDITILIISSVILLIFGELIPKYIAREFADMFIQVAAIPIRGITVAIYPFVKITTSLSSLLTRTENINQENLTRLFDKTDIQQLLHEGSEAGSVEKHETGTINKIIGLSEQRIYEVMTPRIDIVGVEKESSIKEITDTFIKSGYSKLPVYEEHLDNIKGVVYAYDMFKSPKELNDILKNIIFVPETKKTLEMLNEFLEKQISIAVVVDEFGGTAGIVTVEDIIEEMFGEIQDEYDVEEDICRKLNKNSYLISGKVEIDYINEHYNLLIPEGEYETVGGYITTRLGRIPLKGEFVEIDHFKIHIIRSDHTRIDLVKLTVDLEKYEELTFSEGS
jgi:CBS domain containing-hemolysin-like protein